MKKRRLKNKFLENRTDSNKREYSEQRNYCVCCQKKSKKLYYVNLDEKKRQIKLFGRGLNWSYLTKSYQKRN